MISVDDASAGGRRVVVGLGAPDRGDDAIGPAVARAVGELLSGGPAAPGGLVADALGHADLTGVKVVEREDPTSLIELWAGSDLAVVIDAVVSGGETGTVHLLTTGTGMPPLTESGGATPRGGTHGFGLVSALELARALGTLPRRVVVVGVEAASFDHGAPLSPPVADAVDAAVAQVLTVLAP